METKNEVSLIEKIKGDIIHSISDIYSDNGWDALMQLLSTHVSLWLNILIGQIFGACIFYYVDKMIFR